MLADDTVLGIVDFHNDDDDGVEPEDASFISFQLPDGTWSYAILSDYEKQMQ